MAAAIQTAVWTRKEWTTKRDAEKVPSGASPKANVGAALDKFHKANEKSPIDGEKAAKELVSALNAYKQGAAKKYPKWTARVDKNLVPLVSSYIASVQKLQGASKVYPGVYQAAMKETEKVGKEFMQWQKAGGNGKFKPANAKPTVKALNDFLQLVPFAIQLTPKVTEKTFVNFQKVFSRTQVGTWDEPTVTALVKLMTQVPEKI